MGRTSAIHRATVGGRTLADRLRPAHTHWTRLRGLLGTKRLEPGEGLWIKPSNQIHMFGMPYALDLVFLDDAGRVLRLVHALGPNRVSPRVTGATRRVPRRSVSYPAAASAGTGCHTYQAAFAL